MNSATKIAIHREDDNELLGYIVHDAFGWEAQTIFGYEIARADSQDATAKIIRERGLGFLMGVWQYFDEDDKAWHSCVLKEVYERRVIVQRTNTMGYIDPDDYKIVTLKEPTEVNLIKST